MIRARLRANPVAIQIPIGAEEKFEGVVDLIRMKAIYWDMETQGMNFEYRDIPASLKAQADEYRAKMIEAAAEANETLMHKYLEGEQLTDAEIRLGLRERSIRNEIVLACAARPSRTRACRRCSMRSSSSCPRRSTCRPSRASATAASRPRARRATRSRSPRSLSRF